MKIFDRLRNRPTPEAGNAGSSSSEAVSGDDSQLPISGYDRLKKKEVTDQFSQLSQVELEEVETYERAHEDRPAVLDKLRYMRTDEPLPGYDALSPEEIAKALSDADSETVKAVRDYERKFAHRQQVMAEAARVLPTAKVSAREDRSKKEKAARVSAATRSTGSGAAE